MKRKGSRFKDDSLKEYFKGDALLTELLRELSLKFSRLGTEYGLNYSVFY